MKILFICKHNRFRSKVAEALFNKFNRNKKIIAFSRGLELDKTRKYVASNVKKALSKFGIKRVNNLSKKLTLRDIKEADIIVNVADDIKISKEISGKKKVINWKVSDTSQSDYEGIFKRVEVIRKKVITLTEKLKNK